MSRTGWEGGCQSEFHYFKMVHHLVHRGWSHLLLYITSCYYISTSLKQKQKKAETFPWEKKNLVTNTDILNFKQKKAENKELTIYLLRLQEEAIERVWAGNLWVLTHWKGHIQHGLPHKLKHSLSLLEDIQIKT